MNAQKQEAIDILWNNLENQWDKKLSKRIIRGLEDAGFTAYYSKDAYSTITISIWGKEIKYDERINIYVSPLGNLPDFYIYHKIARDLLVIDDSDYDENLVYESEFFDKLQDINDKIKSLRISAQNMKAHGYIPKTATIRNKSHYWSDFSYKTQGQFPEIWKKNS